MSYRETKHLRVLIANERKDRLALVAPIVVGLGHEVIAREIDVEDVGSVTARERPDVALAGPDGIALRPGLLAVAEYGEGRVHIFDREGNHRNTLKVSMPFVDTVIWDGAGNLYAGGSFQNTRPPYEGAVVRFSQGEWETKP